MYTSYLKHPEFAPVRVAYQRFRDLERGVVFAFLPSFYKFDLNETTFPRAFVGGLIWHQVITEDVNSEKCIKRLVGLGSDARKLAKRLNDLVVVFKGTEEELFRLFDKDLE